MLVSKYSNPINYDVSNVTLIYGMYDVTFLVALKHWKMLSHWKINVIRRYDIDIMGYYLHRIRQNNKIA